MAERTWAGPGGDDWLVAAPVDTDTALFTATTQNMTEDFAGVDDANLASVLMTPSFEGSIGDESSGWAVECNGNFINSSRSRFIHITGGDTENIERVVSMPAGNVCTFIVSNATTGDLISSTGTSMTVRGDVTSGQLITTGTGVMTKLAGAGSYTNAEVHGRSQFTVYEDPASGGIVVSGNAIARVMHDDASLSLSMYGGTTVFKGGDLPSPYLLGGVLDLSEATDDVDISGSAGEVGPDLVVKRPPQGIQFTVSGTVVMHGAAPVGWPGGNT